MSNDPQIDDSEDLTARLRALAIQFSQQSVKHVIGVVGAGGAGGQPEDENYDRWTLLYRFHCWKNPPGPIVARALTVRFTTSCPEYKALKKLIQPYAVIGIRARVVEESVLGNSQAELLDFLGEHTIDLELNQVASDLRNPVIENDTQFGQFTLDRQGNRFVAKAKWNASLVSLKIRPDSSGKLDGNALQAARTLWKSQKQWSNRIRDYAVKELLPVWQNAWRQDNQAELTADKFKSKMKLESILVDADGSFEFWHHDGGLFMGHSILIRGNPHEGPTGADIPG